MAEIIFDELSRAAGSIILYLIGAFLIYFVVGLFYEVIGNDRKEHEFLDCADKFYNKKSIIRGSIIIYTSSLLLWPFANLYNPIIAINSKEFDKLFGAVAKLLLSPIAWVVYGAIVIIGVIYGILSLKKYYKENSKD